MMNIQEVDEQMHCIPPPSFSLLLSICISLSVVPHPVFLISGLSLRVGDLDVFFLQSKFFAVIIIL